MKKSDMLEVLGGTHESAARWLGIGSKTLRNWRVDGKGNLKSKTQARSVLAAAVLKEANDKVKKGEKLNDLERRLLSGL